VKKIVYNTKLAGVDSSSVDERKEEKELFGDIETGQTPIN
jgi:hypothetical protein